MFMGRNVFQSLTLNSALFTVKLLTFFGHHLGTDFPQLLLDRLP